MSKLILKSNFEPINKHPFADSLVRDAFRNLANLLKGHFLTVAKVVNANEISYIAQDAQPVPDEGQFLLWRDTNAVAGQPLAFIVTKQNGETFTFGSRELA